MTRVAYDVEVMSLGDSVTAGFSGWVDGADERLSEMPAGVGLRELYRTMVVRQKWGMVTVPLRCRRPSRWLAHLLPAP